MDGTVKPTFLLGALAELLERMDQHDLRSWPVDLLIYSNGRGIRIMYTFQANDGVSLHYEVNGSSSSAPLILVTIHHGFSICTDMN